MGTSRSISRALLGLAFGVVVTAASGCGGEGRLSKATYEQTVRAEYTSVQRAFESTRDTSGAALAARLVAAQRALESAAEAIESREPPEQVEEENEELAEGMREYAEQLDEVIQAVGAGRQAVLDRFNAQLASNEAVEQMAEAAEEMKFKGYDLGAIAEE